MRSCDQDVGSRTPRCDSVRSRWTEASGSNANICSCDLKGTPSGRRKEREHGRQQRDRVDRGDLESGHRLLKVSPGCAHCYAETFAERWRGVPGHPYEQGFDLRLWPQRLEQPLRWARPRMIFVNSMSDLFHEDIPDGLHRAKSSGHGQGRPAHLPDAHQAPRAPRGARADASLAPEHLDGRVDREPPLRPSRRLSARGAARRSASSPPSRCSVRWRASTSSGIDWLIAGGESGPRHRPVEVEWVRELRDRCLDEDVAFFFKQWGGRTAKAGGRAARRPHLGRDAKAPSALATV